MCVCALPQISSEVPYPRLGAYVVNPPASLSKRGERTGERMGVYKRRGNASGRSYCRTNAVLLTLGARTLLRITTNSSSSLGYMHLRKILRFHLYHLAIIAVLNSTSKIIYHTYRKTKLLNLSEICVLKSSFFTQFRGCSFDEWIWGYAERQQRQCDSLPPQATNWSPNTVIRINHFFPTAQINSKFCQMVLTAHGWCY